MKEQDVWFVGRTRYGQELKVRDCLIGFGVTHFIPTKKKVVERLGRKKTVEAPVINNLVFLKTNKTLACSLANYNGVPVKYIVDRNTHTMMVVPMKQMEDFMRVFNESLDGPEEDRSVILEVGDKVRVVAGPLAGVEGNVVIAGKRTMIAITLGGLAQARAEIAPRYLEKL